MNSAKESKKLYSPLALVLYKADATKHNSFDFIPNPPNPSYFVNNQPDTTPEEYGSHDGHPVRPVELVRLLQETAENAVPVETQTQMLLAGTPSHAELAVAKEHVEQVHNDVLRLPLKVNVVTIA
ncbi:hypothetical protein PTT_06731 [Pyrenophora teres f. teres 0-1]|uniref:Uncharacterized protein n=1 Tax=Pyrenophora teres f. teres (strain 0-1) TaxID=861557 RepID=E3RG34_PYRTT|nr:hypothetical protein PTT_06731 [Pyrenophora teres f. teres 0-1]